MPHSRACTCWKTAPRVYAWWPITTPRWASWASIKRSKATSAPHWACTLSPATWIPNRWMRFTVRARCYSITPTRGICSAARPATAFVCTARHRWLRGPGQPRSGAPAAHRGAAHHPGGDCRAAAVGATHRTTTCARTISCRVTSVAEGQDQRPARSATALLHARLQGPEKNHSRRLAPPAAGRTATPARTHATAQRLVAAALARQRRHHGGHLWRGGPGRAQRPDQAPVLAP